MIINTVVIIILPFWVFLILDGKDMICFHLEESPKNVRVF